jgi:AcrR family transcriptional regulator
MSMVAQQGTGISLDDIAARADVTRNLLYHYFPRGRPDILVAISERAGHELTNNWETDGSTPLEQRLAMNFIRLADHAMRPSDAWLIHRHGRASGDPELQAIIARFEEVVISMVSLNHFGTPDPPPLSRIAIKGFIAFTETVLDEARIADTQREQVLALVAQTLIAGLQAAASATD